MKKILLVLNHSLAGFGSDEQAQLKPSGKKAPLGPGVTLLPFLQKQGAEIVATLYCGDQYYWLCKKVSCRCGSLRTSHALS